MAKFRLLLTGVFSLIPIRIVKITLLNALGHKTSYKARIGCGLLLLKKITVKEGAITKSFTRIISYINIESVKARLDTPDLPIDIYYKPS
jgi:hypothetical protein